MAETAVELLHADFGARLCGLDLGRPLDEGELAFVREAIDLRSFLVFPGQALDDERQLAFTRQLGAPEIEHVKFGCEGAIDYFGTIGNIDADGERRGADHAATRYSRGNEMWHSDSSFRRIPSFVTITYAHETPARGGETQFVSCRAAWARLPDAMKAEIEPLTAIHDYVFSRSKVAEVAPSHAASLPPVEQKLVRANPRTGARSYYVGSHAREIVGWERARGRRLLNGLVARATREEDILTHRWSPGDLVIWDNRCLIHRGRPYDADRYRRRMRQTRVRGPRPTLEE